MTSKTTSKKTASKKTNKILALPGAKNALVADQKSGNLLPNITNNSVYLVRFECPLTADKYRSFVCVKYDSDQSAVQIRGAQIANNQINNLSSYTDALNLANKNNSVIEEMVIPWHKIISIQNVTYVSKG